MAPDSQLCQTMNECVLMQETLGYNQVGKANTLHTECSPQLLSFMHFIFDHPKNSHCPAHFAHRKTNSDLLSDKPSSKDGIHNSKVLPETLVGTLSDVICSLPVMWERNKTSRPRCSGDRRVNQVHSWDVWEPLH